MNRLTLRNLWWLLLVLWSVTLTGCDSSELKQLTILYTGDTVGEIEYCGCSTEPIGGIARRAAYIDAVRASERHVLVVDAGDLFGYADLMGRLKGDVILKSMGLMGYDALNLSDKDFLFGASSILNAAQVNDVPTVSANVVIEDTHEPITIASHKIDYEGLRVGITGVVAKKFGTEILDSNDLNEQAVAVIEETAALQQEIVRLQDTVDLVVVLSNTGLEGAMSLAESVDGIHVIVAGHGQDITPMPRRINGVHIVKAGYYGQTVGRLDIKFDDNNEVVKATGKIITLNKGIGEDEAILNLLDEFHLSLIDYKDELFDMEEQVPPEGGSYVGASACTSCHLDEYEQWQTTAHGDAMPSLEATGQDYNPECVDCHVTGFNYTGGFKRPDLTPEMADVQCEVCHGASQDHVESDGGVSTHGIPDEIVCRACHSGTRSPNFNYETYSRLIKH
jgi:hypothetical protein